jgi:SAM-dependent methyltransferase
MSPLCESFLLPEHAAEMEPFYPLTVYVCERCFLVQLDAFVPPAEIFSDYAYFSSYSQDWLDHAARYVDDMIDRLRLGPDSFVVEIASNDGYLLRRVVERGVPCLGVEPAANVARAAVARGVPTEVAFFGAATARRLLDRTGPADLMVANNVLAHVPDLNDFVVGLEVLLAPAGVLTIEVPHLLRLLEDHQFDTIYHEHFSYFSLRTARQVLAAHGLEVFDVEELWTHGGSLRIHVKRAGNPDLAVSPAVEALVARETEAGLFSLDRYRVFQEEVEAAKRELLAFLIAEKDAGRHIAVYGAPGKGNTLLNYCGIRTDFVDYAVDRNAYKHGRLTPGTHIPIFPPSHLEETRPDDILILPWNLRDEIVRQLEYTREWGARLIVPIPHVEVVC